MCVGDFNEIAEETKILGGKRQPRRQMEIFNQVLEECRLSDLGFFGPKFAWCNLKEKNELVRERLDRGMASPG